MFHLFCHLQEKQKQQQLKVSLEKRASGLASFLVALCLNSVRDAIPQKRHKSLNDQQQKSNKSTDQFSSYLFGILRDHNNTETITYLNKTVLEAPLTLEVVKE